MAKSDKATMLSRIHDVGKLLLAGAEFGDIRQFASERGWQVSDRQVRRYLEAAYKRLAKITKRDRDQLLGRHLMQRRAIYARSIKLNDFRTALQVLRDEAALQGLYPPTKIAHTTPDGSHPSPGPDGSPLSRRQRLTRLLAAEARDDQAELRLVEHITPQVHYRCPDTMLPLQALHTMTLIYVAEQLESAAMFLNAIVCQTIDPDDNGAWTFVGLCSAHRFRIGGDGWRQFTEEVGIDGDFLVKANYHGSFLELFGEKVCDMAPSPEELQEVLSEWGTPIGDLATTGSLANSWRRLFSQICPA